MAIVFYLASLILPLSISSLFFSAARKVPFKVKSDQVSSQLKTHHWLSLRIKLQMLAPEMSYMILCFPSNVISCYLPPFTWTPFFLEYSRPTSPSGSFHVLLPLGALSPIFPWLTPSSLSSLYSNATPVRTSLTIILKVAVALPPGCHSTSPFPD